MGNLKNYIVFTDQKKLLVLSASFLLISMLVNFYGVAKIGFSKELDSYYFQYAIVAFCIASIIWPLSNILIPLLVKEELVVKSANYIYYFFGLLCVFLYVIITILADYIVDSIEIKLTDFILFMVFLYLDVVYNLVQAQFQKENRYIILNFNALISVGIQLFFVVSLVKYLGIYALILGLIIAKLSFIFISKRNITYQFELDNLSLITTIRNVRPIIFSSLYSKTGEISDRYLSGLLQVGAISTIAFAARISSAITSVINSAIVNQALTSFSACSSFGCCKKILIEKCTLILFLAATFFIGWWSLGAYFIDLIMSQNKSEADTQTVFYTCMVLLIGSALNPITGLINNLLLAYGAVNYVSKSDIFSFTISIILKIYLTIMYGYAGLVLSFGVEFLLKLVIKFIYLKKLVAKASLV